FHCPSPTPQLAFIVDFLFESLFVGALALELKEAHQRTFNSISYCLYCIFEKNASTSYAKDTSLL
ncbi:hypothetical protein MKR43_11485, partial [Staphylococcus haemolyticus]|uniref:hypothetical protein n=1 Tax=Staphylococcus haemolyticus TaxID=1283 RepID=UPI001F0AABD8